MAALARKSLGVTLGPFEVSTDAVALARFATATGATGAGVPTTFPIVWLSHPDIRAAILDLARPGEAAFHEEQTFDHRTALRAGEAYSLTTGIERVEEPARVVLTSTVSHDSVPVLTMRTVLRLVAVPGMGASAPQAVQQ